MARRIELEVDYDNPNAPGFYTNFDNYGAILYYAYTVNQNLALELYKAMVSEYYYKLETDTPLGGLTDANTDAYISINNLPQIISFINNQILPSLHLLPLNLDLAIEWNIGNSFEAFLSKQGSFFNYFNIDDEEQEGYTVKYFIDVYTQLKDFFNDVLNQNVMYKVTII